MKMAYPQKPEAELLLKLEHWLAERTEPVSLLDIVETRDGELIGAYILKGFRAAARQAALETIEHGGITTFGAEANNIPGAIQRVYEGLSRAWSLDENEKFRLLGLSSGDELNEVFGAALWDIPTGVIERVSVLLSIFKAINTLLPQSSRADEWIRLPNKAPVFRGRSALDVMLSSDVREMYKVRQYLQAQIWSS
jgi:hypothetical protein